MSVAAVVALGALTIVCVRLGAHAARIDGVPSRPGPLVDAPRPGLVSGLGRWWGMTLDDAAIDGAPEAWARTAGAVTVTVGAAGAWRGGAIGAVVLVAIAAAAVALVLRSRRGRRGRDADRLLPDLLEHVARGLRSGLDLRAALAASATVGGVHGAAAARVVDRIDAGDGVEAALRPWSERHPRPPVRTVGAALAVAAATGGRSAVALDGVAASLRARRAAADEAFGLATQARASAAVMVALPLVVGGIGAATDPEVAAVLVGTPWGLACLGLGAALDLAGGWWMHRIVSGTDT